MTVTKIEFLQAVQTRLHGLSKADIERSLDFYREMIEDRMEEGISEEEAVAAMGRADDVARDILLDTPLPKLVKAKTAKNRQWRTWEILLLVFGSPLWASLLIASAAVIFSVYVVMWSLVISLWAIDVALGASAIGLLVPFTVQLAQGAYAAAALYMGVSLVSAGLCLGGIILCRIVTRGMGKLSILILRGLKSLIIGGRQS